MSETKLNRRHVLFAAGATALVELTERDSKRVLELLENPPPPSTNLLRAAKPQAKAARQRS